MVHGSTRASRAMPLRSPIGLPVILSLLATLVLAAPTPAVAHHSFAAHFQMDTMVEVEGRVTDIQWVNPHIKIHVEDANGQRWEVEAGPVNLLTRMGVSRDKFVVGDRLRVRGNPGRGDERVIWVSNILLSDNTEILANPRAEPYWESSAVGDASALLEAGDLALPKGDKRSFFRVWSPLLEQFPRPRGDPKLTAAGVAAQSRYGIDKQVVADCETPGMPFAMVFGTGDKALSCAVFIATGKATDKQNKGNYRQAATISHCYQPSNFQRHFSAIQLLGHSISVAGSVYPGNR